MYMMLSLWRIYGDTTYKAWFIVFASVNTLYCCKLRTVLADKTAWWDIFMDWSLMQPNASYPLLRQDLGYEKIWVFPVFFDLTKRHITLR